MRRSAAVVVLLVAVGCSKPQDSVGFADCTDSADACANAHGGDPRWFCDTSQRIAACAEKPRACASVADCCPSQVCTPAGLCADAFTACETRDGGAGSCTIAGQVCATIGVRPSGLGCTFAKCSSVGTCAAPANACFNGFCVGAIPCEGGCPSGQVCSVATNTCSPAPRDAAGTCQRSCGSGQMLVLHDSNNVFDTCDLRTETCDCAAAPQF
jgi:hypothetical protein